MVEDALPPDRGHGGRRQPLAKVRMPKVCFDEVTDGSDWLAKWCKDRKNIGYFCVKACDHPDAERHQTLIADHVYATRSQASAAEFLKGGDSWVSYSPRRHVNRGTDNPNL